MKRISIFMLLIIFYFLVSFSIFGHETNKNVISVGVNLSDIFPPNIDIFYRPGLSMEYERLFNNYFSMGLGIGSNMTLLPYGEIFGRYYPWSETFFIGIGLGLMYVWGLPVAGGVIKPKLSPKISSEIGWKIPIGKRKRWVIIPSFLALGFCYFDEQNSHIYGMYGFCLKIGRKF